ncbi:MAG TPA: M48 family metalloprotease [Candidatus Aquilonibacter sp.]|nr:M48 family metalloprotease [Candidatus Aquilonibacter sp.]
MASFFDEIARNRLKSIALMMVFSAFFVAVIYLFVVFLGGGIFSLTFAVGLVAIYALITYYTGDKLVLAVSGAKEADPKKYRQLYGIIEGLASATQIKMPKVYIIDDPTPNAFATGRSKNLSSVAVTSGILTIMSKNELTGVLAHEMSHVADNDVQFMTIAIVFAGAIGIIAAFMRNIFFFGGMNGDNRNNGGVLLLIAFVIGLLAPFFALLIRLAISRKREYMADANGARLTRDPHSLADALKKIQAFEKNPNTPQMRNVNEVTANLYFSNPFKAESFANLFSTHPPIEERIKKLEAMY